MTSAKSCNFRRKVASVASAVVTSLSPVAVYSYEPGTEENPSTHPLLSEMSMDLYERETGMELTQEQRRAIVHGTIFEDSPQADYIRAYNHFTDFTSNEGILGFLPSLQWSQNEEAQSGRVPLENFRHSGKLWPNLLYAHYQKVLEDYNGNYPEGNHTWQKAVREKNFESLGHLLHLIQDGSVPAHVRNDPHPAGLCLLAGKVNSALACSSDDIVRYFSHFGLNADSYEVWAADTTFRIADLHPQEIPSYDNYESILADMVSFTGNNFVSDNTTWDRTGLFETYAYPAKKDLVSRREGLRTYYYKTVHDGRQEQEIPIARRGFFVDYYLDNRVLTEMWKIQGTRAVELGAAAIKLFLEGTQPGCEEVERFCSGDMLVQMRNSCGQVFLVDECEGNERCRDARCVALPPDDECVSHAYAACWGNDVYWFTSCDEAEDAKEYCDRDYEECQSGQCRRVEEPQPNCRPNSYGACDSGDLYWFNSCNEREGIAEDCDEECRDGRCVDSEQCQPPHSVGCVESSRRACSDGDLYWFNSCGERECIAEDCPPDAPCDPRLCCSDETVCRRR